MKTRLLIEGDTEFYALTAWRVVEHADGRFSFNPEEDCIMGINREKFFGKVSALLISRETLEDAPPIKLPTAADLDAVAEETKAKEDTGEEGVVE